MFVRFWRVFETAGSPENGGGYLGKDGVFGDSGEMEGSIFQVNIRGGLKIQGLNPTT